MAKVNFHTAPTLLLKKYRKAVDQVAASICTSVIPGGLKSYYITLTDDEYAEHLARQALLLPVVVPVDGAPVIQPPVVDRMARPYPIQPNFPADNASEAAFRRYTAKQAIFITFANGVEELKQMIVESMGSAIADAMVTPTVSIADMTIPMIMQSLKTSYGVTTKTDVATLIESCLKPCASSEVFQLHAKKLNRNFLELDEQRAGVAMYQRMEYLIQSTNHLQNIVDGIADYLNKFPVYATQNYDDMVAHVILHLSNPAPTVKILGVGAAVKTVISPKLVETSMDNVSNLLLTMMTRMEKMEKLVEKASKANISNGLSSPLLSSTTTGTDTAKVTKVCDKYCFVHGLNSSHLGLYCKVMLNDPSYSNNHKVATAPALIEGKQGRV
jgi:hypothetical protein